MEKRDLNISFYKAGNGGTSNRITLPRKWINDMGISENDKRVEVFYDEETKIITIVKKK
ncbi:AbrB/MazE/SpoVT family DNA-binding domain-containing protein [Fusobacterium ulcerans]|jgi:hypothetical protein|uniref:AbrB/MazE/SpoVT family DNA-binding domain-containing protein n=1 Tax=Fusobacterium ulcerans TaxID=861 RepID=UPI00204E6283|nr:AbrB/MazE/SpoVT family DNA-binding domain-containing protein [Fusobacterium ulcerans]DAV87490.1 MAG TPA: Toxin SymE, type I toxin-antitoxin system [Caudoviricetes sp.]